MKLKTTMVMQRLISSIWDQLTALSSDGGGTFTSDDAGINTISRFHFRWKHDSRILLQTSTAPKPTITVTEQASNLPVDNATQQIELQGVTGYRFDTLSQSVVSGYSRFSV
ncbi:MAG: hypothetical protein R3C26_22445 [Calditrichia bacterium]